MELNEGYEDEGYEDLYDVISFGEFKYEDYRNGEKDILTPALMEAGFTEIIFFMGERDSFGPLSRVCTCKDSGGNFRRFCYG